MNNLKKWQRYLLMLLLLSVLAIEIPIIAEGQLSSPQKADTIIILGAKLIGNEPSTMLRLRLEEAIKLYQQNYASTIIVSGAQGKDEITSEASIMKAYLVEHGIPADKVLIEDNSFNTYQNLFNSQRLMKHYNLNKAIIVSNASHIRRALLVAQSLGLPASGAPAPMADNPYLTVKQYLREGVAVAVFFAQGY